MKAKQTIENKNVTPKQSKCGKANNIPTQNTQGIYNADVLAGHSIRIYGTMTNHVKGAQEFDMVFAIGSQAVYDRFNLIYVGTIVKIGPKTVTVKHYEHTSDVTMLDLFTFCDRNWNFDAARISKHNS